MITQRHVEFAKERVRQELEQLFPNQAGDVDSLIGALEYWINTREALKADGKWPAL